MLERADRLRLATRTSWMFAFACATAVSAQSPAPAEAIDAPAAAIAECAPSDATSRDRARIVACPAAAATPASWAGSAWFRPLGAPAPRGPAAGSLLATICLAWLVLLGIASVVRPRGWHHRPLFGRTRESA